MGRYDPYDDFDEELEVRPHRGRVDRPHGGMRMTAFAMAALAAVGAVCAVVIIVALEDAAQPGPDDDLWMGLLALLFLACGALSVAGLTLGLVGSCQADRNPLFGIFGIIVNALAIMVMGAVLCLGVLSDF
jgi:hypothetical protein